jgi:mono/diheme cytochrome c family protein
MLYGLQGEIVIDSAKYNGVMPSWKQLTDAELAAALNYVLSSWGNDAMLTDFAPYSSEDIISHRADELTAENIYELRQELDLPEP